MKYPLSWRRVLFLDLSLLKNKVVNSLPDSKGKKAIQPTAISSKGILPTPTPQFQLGETSKPKALEKSLATKHRPRLNVPPPEVNLVAKSWASLLSSTRTRSHQTGVEFFPPESDCSQHFALLEEEEIKEAEEAWGFSMAKEVVLVESPISVQDDDVVLVVTPSRAQAEEVELEASPAYNDIISPGNLFCLPPNSQDPMLEVLLHPVHVLQPMAPQPPLAKPLLYKDPSNEQASELLLLLQNFFKASGLHLNPLKSQLFCNYNHASLSACLGIPIGSLPVTHLGLPLQSGYLSNSSCAPLVEKMRNRLQTWAGLYLSKAGRLELIKSVLLSLSHYWTAGFALPRKTIKSLEQICRRFFWAGEEGKAKIMSVSWEDICVPMNEGGLGIKCIAEWNEAAMGTRLWEIATYHSSLWATWMAGRYFLAYLGPPSEVSVAAFIKDGMWCKLARWPSEFDNGWHEISQLDIGDSGSDILVSTGSKTAYIWTTMLKSLKIPRACRDLFGALLVQKTSLTVQVKWTPPPIGWVKANSDGSLSEDRFGFGAITRNSSGDCVQAIAARTRAASINLLELKGILAGLRLNRGNTSKVWSESDSTTAVAWAQGKGIIPWTALRDLRDIKS
ncbi:hypothetical protein QJS10_CPB12g01020 [Acorus calamus]|uniref:RNase H type-1 domain-containing protein n=1 Tax=Acorus calamus TaxID=4465 RepID=A0AAV9DQT4_ACOCL|nr:hypothetical protein QJS10_CPB12g01020 [Acorus calamus]